MRSDLSEGAFVTLHSQWDAANPKDLLYAQQLDESRQARGARPARQYPCPGSLRTEDETSAGRYLVCDVCGWEIVVRDTEKAGAF